MAPSTLFALFLLCCCTCFLTGEASSPGKEKPHQCYNAIFSFGDSLTDTGNFIAYQRLKHGYDQLPYGKTYFGHPTGRCSNGRLIIDFIAQGVGMPLLPPYLANKDKKIEQGVNFAVAGATAVDAPSLQKKGLLVPTNYSLGVQLEWFKKVLPSFCGSDCKDKLKNSLFLVGEIGGNDINFHLLKRKDADEIKTILPNSIHAISEAIEALIAEGAVTLVVPGNLPVGCSPMALTLYSTKDKTDSAGCLKWLNELAQFENKLLQDELARLRSVHPNAKIIYADMYGAAIELYQSPQKFGFKEALKTCCGGPSWSPYNYNMLFKCAFPGSSVCSDPSQYVNWDGPHLTEAAYEKIATRLLDGSFTNPPFNFSC